MHCWQRLPSTPACKTAAGRNRSRQHSSLGGGLRTSRPGPAEEPRAGPARRSTPAPSLSPWRPRRPHTPLPPRAPPSSAAARPPCSQWQRQFTNPARLAPLGHQKLLDCNQHQMHLTSGSTSLARRSSMGTCPPPAASPAAASPAAPCPSGSGARAPPAALLAPSVHTIWENRYQRRVWGALMARRGGCLL